MQRGVVRGEKGGGGSISGGGLCVAAGGHGGWVP